MIPEAIKRSLPSMKGPKLKKTLMGLSALAIGAMALTGCAHKEEVVEDVVEPDGIEQVEEEKVDGDKEEITDDVEDTETGEEVEEEETIKDK